MIYRQSHRSDAMHAKFPLLSLLALLVAFLYVRPSIAQEPVVAVDNPESLFTDNDPQLHANKQLALHFMRDLLQCNHWENAEKWLSERYIQHNPNGRSGRDGIVAFFTRTRERLDNCAELTSPIVAVLADGDLVTVVMPREYPHPRNPGETYTSTWFYLWRIVDGKLDEHWAPAVLSAP
jgi:predicted SnoaL-like aldol condensation-catalyzing enzyme